MARELIDPDELEAQLREDPARAGKVGQLVGVSVAFGAAAQARAISNAPDPACALPRGDGTRWIAELSLRRMRGTQLASSWTETRTLDRTSGASTVRLAANYHTREGTTGSQAAEWRRIGDDVYIATTASAGDLWYRRAAEENEAERINASGGGMLQALIDAVDGWQPSEDGWTSGTAQLRCDDVREASGFTDRFVASSTLKTASLRATPAQRELQATWSLADGSTLRVEYIDRIVPFEDTIEPPTQLVSIERDRSLARAETLLSKLATDGLAEVLSDAAPAEN